MRLSLAATTWLAIQMFAMSASAQDGSTGSVPPAGVPPGTPIGQVPVPVAQPYGQSMEAGGLTPPAPLGSPSQNPPVPPVPSSDIEDDLDDSKESDSGRGLTWFWVEAQGGFEHVGLQTFNVDESEFSASFVETSSSGGAISAGIGARLLFITLGARGRMGFFDAWQIGRIGGELGFRIPIGIFEPRFDLGAGYAALGNFDNLIPQSLDITGFYARASAGLDIYPVDVLSLGAAASFDFMGLTRPGVSPSDLQTLRASGDISPGQADLLGVEGSGYGSTFAIMGTIGLHL